MTRPLRLRPIPPLRWVRLLAGVCLVTAVSLLALEWGVRLLMPAYHPAGQIDFVVTDGFPLGPPGFVGRLWRNTGDYDVAVRINADGFRDHRDLGDSTDEDLYVVGDSFTFGWGVEEPERYSDRLEALTGRRAFNLAIPTDFDGYARLLEHARDRGAVIRRLIVGVCMENDLRLYRPARIDTGESPQRQPVPSMTRLKAHLTKRSALYNAATAAVHRNPALRRLTSGIGLVTESVDGMNWNVDDPEVITGSVARLARLVAESGADRCLVLVIPSRGLWQGDNQAVERRVHAAFVAALAERGLDHVDLRPLMEQGGDPLSYHFRSDGHWNAAGHDLAARALRNW